MKTLFDFDNKGYIFCLSCLLTMIVSAGMAQSDVHYHIQHFTDENGLPQNSVKGMMLGSSGFVWIATEAGLVRFDGRKMRVHTLAQLHTSSDRIGRFAEDPRTGQRYAVNEQQQYIRIDNGQADYDKASHPANMLTDPMPQIMTDDEVNKDAIARARKRVVGTGGKGQYFLYADQKISFFKHGRLTGTTPFPGKPHFQPFPFEPTMRKISIAETKGMICVDNFIGIDSTLFYHQNSEGDRFLKVTVDGSVNISLAGAIERDPLFHRERNRIRIFHNRIQRQAFAYIGKNIYQVTYSKGNDRLNTLLLVEGIDIDKALISNILYNEADRMLFLGTGSNGLTIISPKYFQVVKDRQDLDFHNVFYAHLPYGSSSVVTPDGLILGAEKALPESPKPMRGASSSLRTAIVRDKTSCIWIIKGKVIYQFSSNGKELLKALNFKYIPFRLYQGIGDGIFVGCRSGHVF